MTIDDVITAVRIQVQDARTPYRYSDATLLNFTNQVLKRIAMLRPDLFTVTGELTPTTGAPQQTLAATAMRIVDVFYAKTGSGTTIANAVEEVERDAFNRAYRNWPTDTAGTPTRWMRNPRSPTTYFLSPPPAAGVTLIAQYVTWPQTYTLSASTITELSEAYFPAIVDGVVFLAESIDAEHAESARAKLFFDSFMSLLGASAKSRVITDTEDSGIMSSMQQEARGQ